MSSPNIEPFRFLEITQLIVKIQIPEIFQVYCTVRKVLADFAVFLPMSQLQSSYVMKSFVK